MSVMKYENQILQAIQTVVDKSLERANFDKTIQATIIRPVDETIGKYLVKYQDSAFYAFSANTSLSYTKGTLVYILVPGNDMTQNKTIIGTVDKLGIDYAVTPAEDENYEYIGKNTISTNKNVFELCSYVEEEIITLYDAKEDINKINLDVNDVNEYIKNNNSIECGAYFKTSLTAEQKFKGNYGIGFDLKFKSNSGDDQEILKTFIIDVNSMNGVPYNFTNFTRQYGIYDIDGENFIEVDKIYIFEYGFPHQSSNRGPDIFISNIELNGLKEIPQEESSGASLSIITPQGSYFKEGEETKLLQAQVKIKGKVVDSDSQSIKYYWFIEDLSVSRDTIKYNELAGPGWNCLTGMNIISEEDNLAEFVPGFEKITISYKNNTKETKYKCIAIYNDDIILSKEIVIKSYIAGHEITIVSDGGNQFYFDLGNPTLTCLVDGKEGGSYSYLWAQIDNNGTFTKLEETSQENQEYNTAKETYEQLLKDISEEKILKEQYQEELDATKSILEKYSTTQRVERHQIHNLEIKNITKQTVYKCQVFGEEGSLIGIGAIIIKNSLENVEDYSLIIENGNKAYKYNEEGISPASPSLYNPETILPLTFRLYNEQGQEIDHSIIPKSAISWEVPNTNSMITIPAAMGEFIEDTSNVNTYKGIETLSYNIRNVYYSNYTNNTIRLKINYKGKTIIASTDLIFTKQGESGTNGTQLVCKIVPNVIDENLEIESPLVVYNQATQKYDLNYTPKSANKWLKVQLWENGEKIYEGTESDTTLGVNVNWEVLKTVYDKNNYDVSNFAINAETGEITLDPGVNSAAAANIIRCTIAYNNNVIYSTMPISYAKIKNSNYEIEKEDNSGYNYVLYTADGKNPQYNKKKLFQINFYELIDGKKVNVSQLETSDYAVDYNWTVQGRIFNSEWKTSSNLIIKPFSKRTMERNQRNIVPIDTFDGACVNNSIKCVVSRKGETLGEIIIPVHMYLNKYGKAAINGWDGNSISIKENEGIILAPQVGAGKKNADNSFTGIFMGSVKENGNTEIETGLFGYNAGERTIKLNAEDGSAEFGKKNSGQIIIDPTNNTAELKSGNYVKGKSGMKIDLSEPSIEWGNGNFSIDKNGMVKATGFATSADVKGLDEKIEKTVKTVDVEYYLSTSTEKAIGGSWSTVAPEWVEGKFMWSRQKVIYVDGTSETRNETCISGAAGKEGPSGADGYTLVLTNNNYSFSGDTLGASASSVTSSVIAYKGTTQINATVGTISGLPTGLTATITNNSSLNTKITFAATTSLTIKSGSVTIPITIEGKAFTKIFNYSVVLNDLKIGGTNLSATGTIHPYGSANVTTVDNDKFVIDGSAVFSRTKALVNEGPIIDGGLQIKAGQQYVTQFFLKFEQNTVNSIHIYNGYNHTNTKVYIDNVHKGSFAKDIPFPTDLLEHKITLYYTGSKDSNLPMSDTSTAHTILQPIKSTAAIYTGYIRNFKTEIGNIATDWSVSPQDANDAINDIRILTENLYTYTDSFLVTPKTPDQEGAPIWANNPTVENGKYLWQITSKTIKNETTYDIPICLTQPVIKKIYQEYATSTNKNINPKEDAGWTEIKPNFGQPTTGEKDNSKTYYLFTRTVTVYDGGDFSQDILVKGDIVYDPSWDSTDALQAHVNEIADRIKNLPSTDGHVLLEQNQITILGTGNNDGKSIIINTEGILYNNGNKTSSVWGIDGTFDAQDIKVTNLSAEDIQNGTLHIGKNFNNKENNGRLEIYDKVDNLIIIGSGDEGFTITSPGKTYSHTRIDPVEGLAGYNDNDNTKIYGHDKTSNELYIKNQRTDGYIALGTIKMIAINSNTHRGIGFIPNYK